MEIFTNRLSIRSKLIIGFSVAFLLIAIFISFFYPRQLQGKIKDAITEEVHTIADGTAKMVSIALRNDDYLAINEAYDWGKQRDPNIIFSQYYPKDEVNSETGEQNNTIKIPDEVSHDEFKKFISSNQEDFLKGSDLYVKKSVIYKEQDEDIVFGTLVVGYDLTSMYQKVNSVRLTNIFISIGIIVVGVIASFILLGRMISTPLNQLQSALEDLTEGEGDLTRELPVVTKDEIGEISSLFNIFLSNLRSLVKRVRDGGLQISSSSSEILAAAEQQASGAAEQAASVIQTTATIKEWATTSKQIAENADLVAQAAQQTLGTAQAGQEAMVRLGEGMNQIRTTSEQSAKRIIDLGEKSQQIGNVIGIIDKIADETHLLALNASIEAARAGEAGRGFAVVATEVRNLAQSVVESTKEIRDLITEIQNSINASVMATEEGTKQVERGVGLAQQTAESLSEIVGMIEQTMESAKQISLSTQQQQSASEQVLAAMQEISSVSTQSATSTKQTTSSTGKLNQLASDLQKAIESFKLQSEEQPVSLRNESSRPNTIENPLG